MAIDQSTPKRRQCKRYAYMQRIRKICKGTLLGRHIISFCSPLSFINIERDLGFPFFFVGAETPTHHLQLQCSKNCLLSSVLLCLGSFDSMVYCIIQNHHLSSKLEDENPSNDADLLVEFRILHTRPPLLAPVLFKSIQKSNPKLQRYQRQK